jgi:hypothetical protein
MMRRRRKSHIRASIHPVLAQSTATTILLTQGSDDWSFLDDVHVAIVAWLDAGGLEMARLEYAPVFATGMGGKGRRRRHSV